MPKRWELLHMSSRCQKTRHENRAAAQIRRSALEQWEKTRGATKKGKLSTYWCASCLAWHVGHRGRTGQEGREHNMTYYMRQKTCNGSLWGLLDRLKGNLVPVRRDIKLVLTASPVPRIPDDSWTTINCREWTRVKNGNLRWKRELLRKLTATRNLLNQLIKELTPTDERGETIQKDDGSIRPVSSIGTENRRKPVRGDRIRPHQNGTGDHESHGRLTQRLLW
jgi:hypothetical protein